MVFLLLDFSVRQGGFERRVFSYFLFFPLVFVIVLAMLSTCLSERAVCMSTEYLV